MSHHSYKKITIFLVFTLFVLGCQSTGVSTKMPSSLVGMMGEDKSVYISFDLNTTKAIFDGIREKYKRWDTAEVKTLLGVTDRVLLGLPGDLSFRKTADQEAFPYDLILEGLYNPGLIRLGLTSSRDWKKSNDLYDWFYNRKTGDKIALPGRRYIYLSNGSMNSFFAPGGERQNFFRDEKNLKNFFDGADIALLAREPWKILGGFIGGNKGNLKKIEFLLLGLNRDENGNYDISITLKTADARTKELLLVPLRFLVMFKVRSSPDPFIKNQVGRFTIEGSPDNFIFFTGLRLRERDILNLFDYFLKRT